MYLFVYGTLKRGQCRARFLADQQYVGTVRTQAEWRLYDLGDYPGLVRADDGVAIEGELWHVDHVCLKLLDREEGCDENLYRREPIELAPPHDGLAVVTYVYQQSVNGARSCGTSWPTARSQKST